MPMDHTLPEPLRLPATQAFSHYVLGVLLGLLVVPLSFGVGLAAGGGPVAGWAAFAALTVGALTLPPVRAARVGGVLTGLFLTVAGGVGWWFWVASQSTWG